MEIDTKQETEDQLQAVSSSIVAEPVDLRERIMLHLSNCDDLHFKSQQIGDPELSKEEKRTILEDVFERSHSTFLSRFGHRLLAEHLLYFNTPSDNESYEVQFYLSNLKKKIKPTASDVQVRNRRFKAMQKLMSEGEYFSVGEMRKRNPLLFDQLLGNFVKNPKVDLNNVEQYQVAHILLNQMEQDEVAELKKSQLEAEMEEAEEYSSSDDAPDDDEGYSTKDTVRSTSYSTDLVNRIPWGSMYKNDQVIGRSRWKNKQGVERYTVNKKADLTQEEKLLLINEFTSTMFNNFLQGKDDFNYSEVDNNSDYDDMYQCEIDEQEKYFDSESPTEAKEKNGEDDELDNSYKRFKEYIKGQKLIKEFQNMNT